METYKIVRFYRDERRASRVIKTGLSLEDAQAYCKDSKTHRVLDDGRILWFDGYTKE